MATFAAPYYFNQLYPLQDEVLQILAQQETEFYLSGGTASSRGYLNHRFSDDLDLFVNDDSRFDLWSSRVISSLTEHRAWTIVVTLREARFVRINVVKGELMLKIELINDVPSHIGLIEVHPVLGRVDSAENILANKITALVDRADPKDFADIWGFCCRMGISLSTAITDADSKAAGIFPVEVARILCSASQDDWAAVKWIQAPAPEQFVSDLQSLAEKLILNT